MSIIKTIREKKGYTQVDLSEKTGLSLRTIQRLESSGNIPKGFTLTSLANEFGMEPDELASKFKNLNLSRESELTCIKVLNLSVLTFLGIPFGNLILPFYIWHKNKNSQLVDEVGRRIINFQILFTLVLSMLMIISPFTLGKIFPKVPFILILCGIAYSMNILVVINTAFKIQRQNLDFLKLSIRVF